MPKQKKKIIDHFCHFFFTARTPAVTINKSRTINIASIKDKEERKYWRELRRINQIPQIFIPTKEVFDNLKGRLKETSQLGGK